MPERLSLGLNVSVALPPLGALTVGLGIMKGLFDVALRVTIWPSFVRAAAGANSRNRDVVGARILGHGLVRDRIEEWRIVGVQVFHGVDRERERGTCGPRIAVGDRDRNLGLA